jgi:hypothetical protein
MLGSVIGQFATVGRDGGQLTITTEVVVLESTRLYFLHAISDVAGVTKGMGGRCADEPTLHLRLTGTSLTWPLAFSSECERDAAYLALCAASTATLACRAATR